MSILVNGSNIVFPISDFYLIQRLPLNLNKVNRSKIMKEQNLHNGSRVYGLCKGSLNSICSDGFELEFSGSSELEL